MFGGELEFEYGGSDEKWAPNWDPDAERPPDLQGEDLEQVDRAADLTELTKLLQMGVLRKPGETEDVRQYTHLTTTGVDAKIKACLEVVSLDIKDAYLQVPQPAPATITVDARIFSKDAMGEVTYVLERLLPGQRIGASSWYNFARDLLTEAGMENYVKEPTLFRGSNAKELSGMILHADDGLLASSAKERERILGVLRSRVVLQVTNPLRVPGDEIEFLKRRYVYSEEGIVVFPNNRYAEALFEGVGKGAKPRDTPADNSFLEKDTSKELKESEARKYREAVGRLLYLSHSRGDLQFATCILASKMAQPTAMSWRWLQRVIGYLKKVPMVGIVLKPASPDACFGYGGKSSSLGPGARVVVESITDADWAGDKQTRRSRTSIQIFVAGSMVASFVRSQRSIALSSGESEFIAVVGGSSEALYIADCLRFLVEAEGLEIEVRSRSDSAACRGITQRVGCGRVRHLDASLLWVQMAVKAKKLVIGTVAGSLNPADIGTKPLAGPRLRELMFLMGGRTVDMESYGEQDHNEACAKRGMAKAFKVEGLSLAGPLLAMVDSELVSLVMTTVLLGSFFVAVFLGVPVGLFWVFAKVCCWQKRERYRVYMEVGVQANLGLSKKEEIFQQEYVQRVTELRGQLSEKCDEVREFEQLVKRLRNDVRALERELVNTRANARLPETIVVAPKGERYHLPGCGQG
ncbi:Retrovirus-related Pol polyprotein from transposon TNT 1-94 [Symbiodinium microadriaticum]|uniref:Retrovirus-related Pol polyprotein from transposon TNT 1-94 n=1 Tax=Symbiodinium microadriaticum TaxID=2951 RepID=A0A1Q9EJ28_SYMMI|nr:Retrovirus-related Pol polyprotein from transposon TNT 1-94 [Symbiodinium microadriaticum]